MTQPPNIRITALDDDPLYLSILHRCVDESEGLTWLGGYRDSETFLDQANSSEVDLFFLDIQLEEGLGLDCVQPIRQRFPKAKIVLLTSHDSDEYVLRAFLQGADGYLLKNSTPEEIRTGIFEVMQGGAVMSASIARKVVRALKQAKSSVSESTNKQELEPESYPFSLSKREIEILDRLAIGQKYTEIAEALFIALPTVKTHIRSIYGKLEVSNKTEAALLWLGQK
jgi:DNA-binding NarL/FixJ family response regulator